MLTPLTNGQTSSKTQLQQEGYISHTRNISGALAQVIWKIVPLDPIRHLHHKAIITSLGVITDLSNTQRQTQKCRQNEETNKYATNERTNKIPRKINKLEATKIPNRV